MYRPAVPMPGSVIALNRDEEDQSKAGLDPILPKADPIFGFNPHPESTENEEVSVSTVPRIPQPTGSGVTSHRSTSVSGSFYQFPVVFNFEDLTNGQMEEKSSLAQIGTGPFDVRSESRLTSKGDKSDDENRSFKEEKKTEYKTENVTEIETLFLTSKKEQLDEVPFVEESKRESNEDFSEVDSKTDSERLLKLKEEKLLDAICVKDLYTMALKKISECDDQLIDEERELKSVQVQNDVEENYINVIEEGNVIDEGNVIHEENVIHEGNVVDEGNDEELDRDRIDRDFRAAFFGFGEDGRTFENIPDENPSEEEEEEDEERKKEKKKSVIKVLKHKSHYCYMFGWQIHNFSTMK